MPLRARSLRDSFLVSLAEHREIVAALDGAVCRADQRCVGRAYHPAGSGSGPKISTSVAAARAIELLGNRFGCDSAGHLAGVQRPLLLAFV